MKQLYYGNELERDGYKILACSAGIPDEVKVVMEECAVKVNPETEYGLVMLDEAAVFYANSKAEPRVDLGEQRPTQFSHQYYISGEEYGTFLDNMANVLSKTEFVTGYQERYDVEDKPILGGGADDRRWQSELSKAAEWALKEEHRIIIYANWMSGDMARGMMAQIAAELAWEQRAKAGFIYTENARDARIRRAAVVFCGRNSIDAMKSKIERGCIYYDADSGQKTYSWDVTPQPTEPSRVTYVDVGGGATWGDAPKVEFTMGSAGGQEKPTEKREEKTAWISFSSDKKKKSEKTEMKKGITFTPKDKKKKDKTARGYTQGGASGAAQQMGYTHSSASDAQWYGTAQTGYTQGGTSGQTERKSEKAENEAWIPFSQDKKKKSEAAQGYAQSGYSQGGASGATQQTGYTQGGAYGTAQQAGYTQSGAYGTQQAGYTQGGAYGAQQQTGYTQDGAYGAQQAGYTQGGTYGAQQAGYTSNAGTKHSQANYSQVNHAQANHSRGGKKKRERQKVKPWVIWMVVGVILILPRIAELIVFGSFEIDVVFIYGAVSGVCIGIAVGMMIKERANTPPEER